MCHVWKLERLRAHVFVDLDLVLTRDGQQPTVAELNLLIKSVLKLNIVNVAQLISSVFSKHQTFWQKYASQDHREISGPSIVKID